MGFVIAIAWPETKVKCVGVWYDRVMKWTGHLKNGYYNVGHAAALLVNPISGKVHYFDFGRYQAPLKHGRIRDEETDPDLTVKTRAKIINGKLVNIEAILRELSKNKSTHGKGKLVASQLTNINFNLSLRKTKKLQGIGVLPYGPFDLKGTNCSRFVTSVALFGKPGLWRKIRLWFPYTVSPSPMSNIFLINNQKEYYQVDNNCFEIVPIGKRTKMLNAEPEEFSPQLIDKNLYERDIITSR